MPGNTQKWDRIESIQGTFAHTKGDVVTALGAKNGADAAMPHLGLVQSAAIIVYSKSLHKF
jgi:hypothetical protein